ncbi:hypothetical protein A0H81_04526 [Grifola frondosa]|uniref:Uncharacterized protein n=1 Tax=Grifola frondosa TaxID=5627 RepID=A0A1C7ME72_GRIFR|nr:hypothetical protein A0H81_04526 [Grifola frondosa]
MAKSQTAEVAGAPVLSLLTGLSPPSRPPFSASIETWSTNPSVNPRTAPFCSSPLSSTVYTVDRISFLPQRIATLVSSFNRPSST